MRKKSSHSAMSCKNPHQNQFIDLFIHPRIGLNGSCHIKKCFSNSRCFMNDFFHLFLQIAFHQVNSCVLLHFSEQEELKQIQQKDLQLRNFQSSESILLG